MADHTTLKHPQNYSMQQKMRRQKLRGIGSQCVKLFSAVRAMLHNAWGVALTTSVNGHQYSSPHAGSPLQAMRTQTSALGHLATICSNPGAASPT